MQLLDGLNIKELSVADLTGEWEYKLKQIENGKSDKDTFIKEIRTMVSNIVEKTKSFDSKTIPGIMLISMFLVQNVRYGNRNL